MKPGTARAFASRRRAHSRAPGPESLSLGSLGDLNAHFHNETKQATVNRKHILIALVRILTLTIAYSASPLGQNHMGPIKLMT